MSLTNGATLLASSAFQGQVAVAMLKLSNDIKNNVRYTPAWDDTAQDAKRAKIADAILYTQGTVALINALVARLVIATNATVRAATVPNDSDVEYVCSTLLGSTPALNAILSL